MVFKKSQRNRKTERFLRNPMSYISSYSGVLKKLKNYKTIILGGAEYSGTTYTTHILAEDLGYKPIDEDYYGDYLDKFLEFTNWEKVVVQNTRFSHIIDELEPNEDSIFVWLHRPDEDVIKSEDRRGWHPKGFKKQQMNYTKKFGEGATHFERNSYMKKFFWHNYQKIRIKLDFVQINYYILEGRDEYNI